MNGADKSVAIRDRSGVVLGLWVMAVIAFALCVIAGAAYAGAATVDQGAPASMAAEAADPHAHHHHVMPEVLRSVVDYAIPDVKLVRDDGKSVLLDKELDDGRAVVLSFIYTSCTTVCPLTSQTFSQLQTRLGAQRRVHLMSISIDPEQDTPARLSEYAKKFGAGPQWQHYTGTLAASVAAQSAFNVYRGDKMSHVPATFVRVVPGVPWVRIDGFATADQLLAELHDAATSR